MLADIFLAESLRRELLLVVQADLSADPARIVEVRENRQRLWGLAAVTLTESQWTSLWLFYVEDMALSEIARVLQRSSSAVKALLNRARCKLATEWDGEAALSGQYSTGSALEIIRGSRIQLGRDDG